MDIEIKPEVPVENVVVCHPERLIAVATAATLRRSGTARSVAVAQSLTQVLSFLSRSVQVAVIFDSVEEDIADLLEALRHRGLAIPVVIVTERPTPDRIARAIEFGAAGLVPVSAPVSLLCRSVIDAGHGHTSFALSQPREVMAALQERRLQRYQAQSRLAELNAPERQVLRLLADGTSVTAIAGRMAVSPRTVRCYVSRLGTKLGTRGQLRIAAAGRHLLAAVSPPNEYGQGYQHGAGA